MKEGWVGAKTASACERLAAAPNGQRGGGGGTGSGGGNSGRLSTASLTRRSKRLASDRRTVEARTTREWNDRGGARAAAAGAASTGTRRSVSTVFPRSQELQHQSRTGHTSKRTACKMLRSRICCIFSCVAQRARELDAPKLHCDRLWCELMVKVAIEMTTPSYYNKYD